MPQSGAGEGSESVLLGCLVKEYLRLWPSDGRAECVRVLHPSDLRGALARGVAPRTSLVPGRFREAGRLEPSGTLRIGKQKFAVEVSEEPVVSQALWVAAGEVFQDAAAAALQRGEYLVVETGGWEIEHEPFAIAGARKARRQVAGLRRGGSRAPRAVVAAADRREGRTRDLCARRTGDARGARPASSPTRRRRGRARRSTWSSRSASNPTDRGSPEESLE